MSLASCMGDDFTSRGSDEDLDWVEQILATAFDIKVRGRIGVGCPGDNEIRILNRIVRITENGLEYEADPRHVDLITESLDLAESKPVATPGVKNPDPALEAEKDPNDTDGPKDILDLFCALTSGDTLPLKKEVHFHKGADSACPVTPYSDIYGWLPSTRVATSRG